MLYALVNSAFFFLGTLQLGLVQWLSFNACSLAIIAYLVCFVCYLTTKRAIFLAIPLLPLYYYGTMGLFVTAWTEANLFAQITHIIITVNVIWLLYVLLKERQYETLGKGCLAAILAFVPVFAAIQSYAQSHMDEFIRALQTM